MPKSKTRLKEPAAKEPAVKEEKTPVDWSYLNGTYRLQGDDFIRIQWYPGCQLFYGIINDKSGAQGAYPAATMIRMLRKYSSGFTTRKDGRKAG
jgi:hypothetical protein